MLYIALTVIYPFLMGEIRNAHRILVMKPKEKVLVGTPISRRRDIIKTDLRKQNMKYELAQNTYQRHDETSRTVEDG